MVTAATKPMGVKDTKEAMIGINELALTLARIFSDGVQFQDFMELWRKVGEDETFKAQLMAAYEGWGNIPDELADIDVQESLEIIGVQLSYVPKLLEVYGHTTSTPSAVSGTAQAAAAKK